MCKTTTYTIGIENKGYPRWKNLTWIIQIKQNVHHMEQKRNKNVTDAE